MNDKNSEKKIKEKIDSLDSLSAGIVYGKAETWNKLEERLNRKQSRRIVLAYRLAAAAALLILVSLIRLFYQPAPGIVKIEKENKAEQTHGDTIEQKLIPEVTKPETMYVHLATKQLKHKQQKIEILPDVHQKPDTPKKEIVMTVKTNPVENKNENGITLSERIRNMKVVHINELDNDHNNNEIAEIAKNATTPFIKAKLPVVHINDLMRTDFEMKPVFLESRLTLGHVFFFRPGHFDVFDDGYQTPPFSMKRIKLN